jgi:hypothetical protein
LVAAAVSDLPTGTPIRILFQDEGRFGRISDTRRCWAPLPLRAVVGHQVIREYVHAFMAVSPHDGRCASLVLPWVDAETMSMFLAHTAAEFSPDVCVILLDGAGWHRANDLRIPSSIRLVFLPPYSPELNPVEHLWDYLRDNHFGNDTFSTLEAVIDRLCVGLRDLLHHPDVVASMTQFDWIKTLCMMSN